MTNPWDYTNEDYRPDTVEEIDEAIERAITNLRLSAIDAGHEYSIWRADLNNGHSIIWYHNFNKDWEGPIAFENVRDFEEWIDENTY